VIIATGDSLKMDVERKLTQEQKLCVWSKTENAVAKSSITIVMPLLC
jgi:hypothetical protein